MSRVTFLSVSYTYFWPLRNTDFWPAASQLQGSVCRRQNKFGKNSKLGET